MIRGWFDVVVQARRSQQTVRAALVDDEPGLRCQTAATAAQAVVLQGTASSVIGDGAMFQFCAAPGTESPFVEGAQVVSARVGGVLAHRLAQIAAWRESSYQRTDVT